MDCSFKRVHVFGWIEKPFLASVYDLIDNENTFEISTSRYEARNERICWIILAAPNDDVGRLAS